MPELQRLGKPNVAVARLLDVMNNICDLDEPSIYRQSLLSNILQSLAKR